jgi:nitroreductase
MVRSYHAGRPVPPDVVDRIVHNGLRAPSAGFSQGWGFLVLDSPADVARFRDAVRPETDPEGWFAASVDAPLLMGSAGAVVSHPASLAASSLS